MAALFIWLVLATLLAASGSPHTVTREINSPETRQLSDGNVVVGHIRSKRSPNVGKFEALKRSQRIQEKIKDGILETSIDPGTPTVVRVYPGDTAYLMCRVINLGTYSVVWMKDHRVLTIDTSVITIDQRLFPSYDSVTGTWLLELRSVRMSDAGEYQCMVSSKTPNKHSVTLQVVPHGMALMPTQDRSIDEVVEILKANLTYIQDELKELQKKVAAYHHEEEVFGNNLHLPHVTIADDSHVQHLDQENGHHHHEHKHGGHLGSDHHHAHHNESFENEEHQGSSHHHEHMSLDLQNGDEHQGGDHHHHDHEGTGNEKEYQGIYPHHHEHHHHAHTHGLQKEEDHQGSDHHHHEHSHENLEDSDEHQGSDHHHHKHHHHEDTHDNIQYGEEQEGTDHHHHAHTHSHHIEYLNEEGHEGSHHHHDHQHTSSEDEDQGIADKHDEGHNHHPHVHGYHHHLPPSHGFHHHHPSFHGFQHHHPHDHEDSHHHTHSHRYGNHHSHGHHKHGEHYHLNSQEQWHVAHCIVQPNAELPESEVKGQVIISQNDDGTGPLYYDIDLTGLPENANGGHLHGFHIHENMIQDGKCSTAGGHFNPTDSVHGSPDASVRHVGDLGNIETGEDGELHGYVITEEQTTFSGPSGIIGRSIVIHADEDDLGLGGDEDSLATGNAGARLACCTIVAGKSSDTENEETVQMKATRIRFNG